MKPVRVALLGCGVVGTEIVRLLDEQSDDLAARVGAPVELAGIAVRITARALIGPPSRASRSFMADPRGDPRVRRTDDDGSGQPRGAWGQAT